MRGIEKKNQNKGTFYKAYVITDGKKFYIDPEFLKKLAFNPHESYIFTGKRIHIEKT
jgi:predicted glycosyltransferase